jgi:hypothetical protein
LLLTVLITQVYSKPKGKESLASRIPSSFISASLPPQHLQNLPFPKTIEKQPIKIITLATYAFRKASAHHKTLERNNTSTPYIHNQK